MNQARTRKEEIHGFLKKEAKAMYRQLNLTQKRLTTWQDIWRGLRKSWKAGNQVEDMSAAARTRYVPGKKEVQSG